MEAADCRQFMAMPTFQSCAGRLSVFDSMFRQIRKHAQNNCSDHNNNSKDDHKYATMNDKLSGIPVSIFGSAFDDHRNNEYCIILEKEKKKKKKETKTLKQKVNKKEQEVKTLQQNIKNNEKTISKIKNDNKLIKSTISWRITKPLRYISKLIK